MYEGIISLAWADHVLTEDERAALQQMINDNPRFTPEQRELLKAEIDKPVQLKDVWPRITDKYDRAYLLDSANVIFMQDGKFCEDEKETYDTFLAKHLDSIESHETLREIQEMAKELRMKRKLEEAAAKAEAQAAFADRFGFLHRIRMLFPI